jgi:sulfur carrier protein
MKQLKINGIEKTFSPAQFPATVGHLLSSMNIEPVTVVVEIDGQIIQRVNFNDTPLSQGQSIELIRFVGGG